ncbi:hypothetical protein OSTOST_19947 [Ostertagia ostertagi]
MESPAWMFTKALSHRQKVCRLYKKALREIDNWYGGDCLEVRYQKLDSMQTRMRKTLAKANTFLLMAAGSCGKKGISNQFRYPLDPGGSSYDRYRESPDQIVDSEQWTLPEKEQFPYYFNRREQRKKELLAHWSKIEKAWDDEIAAIQTTLPKEKPTTKEL